MDSSMYSSDVEMQVISKTSRETGRSSISWHRPDDLDDKDASPRVADHSTRRRRQSRLPMMPTTTSTGVAAPLFLLSSPVASGGGTYQGKGKGKEVVEIDLLDSDSEGDEGQAAAVELLSSGSGSEDDGGDVVVQGSPKRRPQKSHEPPPRPPTSDEDGELPDPVTMGFAPARAVRRPIMTGRAPIASTSSARLPPEDPPRQPTPPPPPARTTCQSGSGSAILSMLDQLPAYNKALKATKTNTNTNRTKAYSKTTTKRKRSVIYDDDDDEEGATQTSISTDSDSEELDDTSASFRGPPRMYMMNSEGGPIVELPWREESAIWEKEMAKERAHKKAKKKEKTRNKAEEKAREKAQEKEKGAAVAVNGKRKAGFQAPPLSLDERETIKANKAAEKERKALEKARLAKEKAALVKANNLRAGDKATTVRELTIHLSGTDFDPLSDTEDEEDEEGVGAGGKKKKKAKKRKKSEQPQWINITKLLQQRMDPQGCAVECPEMPRRDLGCEGAIRWTRWCDRRWNMEKSIFEPLGEGNEIVVEEDSRLVYISALQLSTQIANKTLLRNLKKIQERIGAHSQIILMHYGLNALYREMENAKQAAYREDARSRLDHVPVVRPSVPRWVGIGERQPDKEVIQMELLRRVMLKRVQSQSRCFMIAVNSVEEAVDWIEQLTYDVSQKPYQRQKNMHIAALGTGEEKFASGSNLEDTFVKMLATLKSVTEPVAKGIVGHYPTVKNLYDGWAKLPLGERKNMLVGIGRGSNVTGVATNRTIGTKLSETIYKIFTSGECKLSLVVPDSGNVGS
ncbi:BQ2448_6656 [Microbotryum intermedium]|uniref:BQ2448_6656 protein n=1 Tax=Microbotryum intermedium TaxID=269621 RepID=A0A238FQQ9_9BASI|nr:BQ2448_6656 [Microbotryum intermedium]